MASPKSCAILGHNPMRFAWGFDEEAAECHDMKMELAQQIMVLRQQGVTHFSVACDYGVGLYAAEIINALRNDDSELMLFCITPYEEQATKWTPALRERYFDMLIKCTHMTAVTQICAGGCLANAAFLVGDGDNLCVHFSFLLCLEQKMECKEGKLPPWVFLKSRTFRHPFDLGFIYHGSVPDTPIACDAFNARTVAECKFSPCPWIVASSYQALYRR